MITPEIETLSQQLEADFFQLAKQYQDKYKAMDSSDNIAVIVDRIVLTRLSTFAIDISEIFSKIRKQ